MDQGDSSSVQKRTIYVGNLPIEATEVMLSAVFAQFGQVLSCKIMRDPANRTEPYAFIEFTDHTIANMALNAMNRIKFMGKELRVNWATSPGGMTTTTNRPDHNRGFHIFVGDLVTEVDDAMLEAAFSPYGPIYEAKVVRYPDGRSRGYAFISYKNEADAEEAINKMDKTWMVNKAIRVNWATRKNQNENQRAFNARPYEEVYQEASLQNTTVYCGGIGEGLTEELVKANFIEFGQILDVRIFADKGYAFIRYETHDSAARAISEKHGLTINGYTAKCSWGKENFGQAMQPAPGNMPNMSQPPPGMSASYPNQSTPSSYDEYCKQYYQYYQQQYYYQYYQQYYQQQQQQHQQQQQPQSQQSGNSYQNYGPPSGGSGGGGGPPMGGYHQNYNGPRGHQNGAYS